VESYGRPESLAGREVLRKPRAHVLGSGGAIGELGLEQMEGWWGRRHACYCARTRGSSFAAEDIEVRWDCATYASY
jgi:hypothetical protein